MVRKNPVRFIMTSKFSLFQGLLDLTKNDSSNPRRVFSLTNDEMQKIRVLDEGETLFMNHQNPEAMQKFSHVFKYRATKIAAI